MTSPSGDSIVAALRRRGVEDVSVDRALRSAYSFDASLYRVEPAAVARPRSPAELVPIVRACAEAWPPNQGRTDGDHM